MAKKPRWETISFKDGSWEVEFFSWKYFHDFVRQEMLEYSHYFWRGQLDSGWDLQTSLDRALKGKPIKGRKRLALGHLKNFKYAARGRRGLNPSALSEVDDWWALGQHNGLATPLLDWTESPFVAMYFAFEKAKKSKSGFRSVWALGSVNKTNAEIRKNHKPPGVAPTLDVVRPLQDDNSRLVNQAGLFTKVPLGKTVNGWVKENHVGSEGACLIHLKIPDKDRLNCLRTLSKMNINHVTLFPDLYGAGEHCNKALQIGKY